MNPRHPDSTALVELYEWAKREDFSGHDPHDLLNAPAFSSIRSNPDSRVARWARLFALQLGRRSTIDLRSLLQVPRGENPKALALFLTGLLRAKNAVTPDWERDAATLADRLMRSMSGAGWGYPFPWQSRTHYLPPGTPNIVTTSFVGTALIEWHRHSPSASTENAIRLAAAFVCSLKVSFHDTQSIVFGYAQNDPQIVFNASILGAEFLLNAGRVLGNESYVDLAHRAAAFVREHQRADGGWDYGLEKSQHWTDSFHTGFTIRAMKSIAKAVRDSELISSAARGFEYYQNTFLEPDFAIKYFPGRRYPIDAHAIGEAMLTFEAFGVHETAEHIAEWCIEHLRSPNGYFYYRRHRLFTNKIPYIRWSDAWIFRGLAEVASTEYRVPSTEYRVPNIENASQPPSRLKNDVSLGTRCSVLGTPHIWIDLENSPHVPFFVPIIRELESAGATVVLTARDFAQTLGLIQQAGLKARTVGRQGGSSPFRKSISLLWRTLRLAVGMRGKHIDLAVGHGSRGLLLAAKLLRIPTLTLYDYEGASVRLFNRLSDYVMTPEIIPASLLEARGLRPSKHFTYPGLKEDIYVSGFQLNSSTLEPLKLDPSRIIVTIRPPSSTAHYRSEESFRLYDDLMQLLESRTDVQVILVPREHTSIAYAKRYAGNPNIIVPSFVVNGLNLLYYSDLMISGGGTMVREAAALGIPAITIFKGEMGGVDRSLIEQGRMDSIERAEEILPFLKKRETTAVKISNSPLETIVQTILFLAKQAHVKERNR